MKKNRYNKNMLVRELAFSAGITQKKARFVLEALSFIAYREASDQGFTLPGLCRMDIIRRKTRKMRNPQTGETILIAEHDALRVRPVKKARDAITPPQDNLITVLPSEENAAATPAPTILDDFSKAVSFRCKKCGQEIEAPIAAVGMQAECPVCAEPITIHAESEPGTLHGPALPEPIAEMPFPSMPSSQTPVIDPVAEAPTPTLPPPPLSAPTPAAPPPPYSEPDPFRPIAEPTRPVADAFKLKNQTIRIDLSALGLDTSGTPQPKKFTPKKRMLSFFCKNCRQEIESPADMAGSAAECPACGVSFEVPFFSDPGTLHGSDLDLKKDSETIKSMKSRTIRIEVPDDI